MHDEAGLIYSNALRLEPDNLEVFIEAAANLQADERHEEALLLLQGVPHSSRMDAMVAVRTFIGLYSVGRQQAAFAVLDAGLERTPDLCALILEHFPIIQQDGDFGRRVLNAPKPQ